MSVAPKNPKDEPAVPASAAPEAVAPTPEKPAKAGKGKDEKEGKEKKGKAPKAGAGPPGTKKATKVIPDNPNFRYIVRLAGTDLDGTRAAALALTGVRGVGRRVAEVACRMNQVNPREMIGNLPEPVVDGIETFLTDLTQKVPGWMVNHRVDPVAGTTSHVFGAEIETFRRDDVNRMKMIRSYRGVRHERGQKVRGQRTRSNGRTGMAAGVLKKAAKEAAAAAGKETAPAAAPAAPAAEKKE